MELAIIVAAAENHVIGRDNGLIWHLSADLKRFSADDRSCDIDGTEDFRIDGKSAAQSKKCGDFR